MVCPKCGKEDCEVVTETSTSGKDVSAGKACCGTEHVVQNFLID